jgi:hypothetical protein
LGKAAKLASTALGMIAASCAHDWGGFSSFSDDGFTAPRFTAKPSLLDAPIILGVSVNGTDQSTALKARGKLHRADEELLNKGRNSLKASWVS